MKYILPVILGMFVAILSYLIFLPYLLMTFRFKAHYNATQQALTALSDWVDTGD